MRADPPHSSSCLFTESVGPAITRAGAVLCTLSRSIVGVWAGSFAPVLGVSQHTKVARQASNKSDPCRMVAGMHRVAHAQAFGSDVRPMVMLWMMRTSS